MDSPRTRAIVGVLALVAVVILFIALSGGDSGSTTTAITGTDATGTATTATTEKPAGGKPPDRSGSAGGAGSIATITVKDGQPVGGVQKLTFTQPQEISFRVDSDTADEVHFHGYEIGKDVEAGGSVTFDVPSTIAGVFEVELENAVVPLAEITVNPG